MTVYTSQNVFEIIVCKYQNPLIEWGIIADMEPSREMTSDIKGIWIYVESIGDMGHSGEVS